MDTDAHNYAEDEVEEEEKEFEWKGRDAMIFLIDATQPMFREMETEGIPFITCLECCKITMLNKIIGSQKDLIAVVFFGTKETSNALNVKHIITFQDLSQPSAEKIKQLDKMLVSDDFDGFHKTYGHSCDFTLSDALWLCQNLFSSSSYKLSSQRVLLFTCTDNPHDDKAIHRHQAFDRARILGGSGADLELLHLGKHFNPSIFYEELVQMAWGDDYKHFILPDPSSKVEELLTRVCRPNHSKYSIARLLFKLGKNVELAVSIHNLVRRTFLPREIPLERATNRPVHPVLQLYNGETGQKVLPSDVVKYQIFGDRKIKFRKDEVKNIYSMLEPGIHLLGFKPETCVDICYHFKPSSFMYPDENTMKGSRQLFAALLSKCIERNVIAICWLVRQQASYPQLIALVPQFEKLNDTNIQILPPGFHIVFLPYEDNIRTLELPKLEKPSIEEVDILKKIINKLRSRYNPHSFDNPKLQTHWSNIEALAMEYSEPKAVPDYTKPDNELIARKLGKFAEEFREMFYPPEFDPYATVKSKPAVAVKREGKLSGSTFSKIPKLDSTAMLALAEEGRVEKLTNDELKAFLRGENVSVTNKRKAELVEMVYECLHFKLK